MTRRGAKYSRDAIKNAVEKSKSWAQVCRILGISPASGSQSHLTKRAKELCIDCSHFTGQGWSKGKVSLNKRPIQDYLEGGYIISSSKLRWRLIKEGLKPDRCEECGLSVWMGQKIPLELDHLDSDHWNNSLANLRIVCPNCHALLTIMRQILLTASVMGEKRVKRSSGGHKSTSRKCAVCGIGVSYGAKTCLKCRPAAPYERATKIQWPPLEALIEAQNSRKVWSLAKTLGVSDNAIHKRIKRYTSFPSEGKVEEPTDCNPVVSGFDDRPVVQNSVL